MSLDLTPAPGAAQHRIIVTAEAADIDELEHVSNLVYVRWVQDVAMAHTRAVGWDHAEYRALGAIFVVRRHEIEYVQPVVLGEEIELHTWVAVLKGASSERRTAMRRVRDGAVVARAVTTWAFIDLASGRPTRIPEAVRAAFAAAVA